MVTFSQLFFRVEVDFFEDHVEYSYFVGDESVKSDLHVLDLIIKEEPAKLKALGILPASI